jgi:hypothetical protein
MIDAVHAIVHNNIMVIDGEMLITESFKCATSSVV